MPSTLRYLDEIQTAVFSPASADPDLLRDAAAEYAEACAHANQRLRDVGQLLHQGLRSEAIQAAEREPNLLDLIAALDFPELGDWCALLQQWGMVTPPPLLIEIAASLNEAYAELLPLETHLRAHRVLALARAPLTARIATIKRIIAADPLNKAWVEDLELLQRARIKQIALEARQADAERDADALKVLHDELAAGDWQVPIPSELLGSIAGSQQRASRNDARELLEGIAARLISAHSAFDVESGRVARDGWTENASKAQLLPNEPIAQDVAPALAWLAEEDRQTESQVAFARNLATLDAALDEGAGLDELERIHSLLHSHDEEIPNAIANRFEQRVASLELSERRKHRLVLTGLVGALVVIAAIIAVTWDQLAYRSALADAGQALEALIEEDRIEEAHDYMERLRIASPRLMKDARVKEQDVRIQNLWEQEQGRAESFLQAMAQAEEDPKVPDRGSLSQARELARTSDEKARVAALDNKIRRLDQLEQERVDAEFDAKISQLSEQVAEFARNREASVEQLSFGEQLLSELRETEHAATKVSDPLRAQLSALLKRQSASLKAIEDDRARANALAQITSSVGDPNSFSEAISRFAEEYPDTLIASNYDNLQEEAQLWIGYEAWRSFLDDPSFANLRSITSRLATQLSNRGDMLLEQNAPLIVAKVFEGKREHLESVAFRSSERCQSMLEDVKALMRDPLVSGLWMVQLRETADAPYPDCFYSKSEPSVDDGQILFRYITGFDLKEKTQKIPQAFVGYYGVAPQTVFANDALPQLAELVRNEAAWDKTFLNILRRLHDQERMDPVLKLLLAERILAIACEGSALLTEIFGEHLLAIGKAEVDLTVDWMNPESKLASEARHRARAVMDSLPSVANSVRQARPKINEITKKQAAPYVWVGWLNRDRMGALRLEARDDVKDGTLWVVHRRINDEQAGFSSIGEVRDNIVTWRPNATEHCVVGRPVYLDASAVAE